MQEQFVRLYEHLIARVSGPLHFRLLLQPLMATIFAVKSGLKDAREGNSPYLWLFVSDKSQRKGLVREAWKSVGKIFIIALIIDAVYQYIAVGWFYPLEALITAIILAILPYICLRGIVNRIAVRTPIKRK